MLSFNMLTRFVLLSCVVAVCMAELSPKEEVSADEWTQDELERKVYDNKVKLDETTPKEDVPTNDAIVALVGDIDALELADPIKSAEIAESIESALTGYDVVIGDPLNVVNSGTVKDKGVKKQIFQYDPNDQRSLLQTSVQTGCSSTGDSTVISTVGKYRKQVDKEAEVSGSVSGSGFGVSASFAFSASTSSTEVEDFITQKHGSLTIFTMTCSLRHLDVGNTDVGLPPFKWKFANFITDTLGDVPTGNAPESIRAQKLKFKSLLTNYGTHYIYQATIGARVTTTKFLSQSMTSTMSQSTRKACASASASADYMAVSVSVSASGCSASDKSKFNSRDQGVTKTVKNSYGTTKVAGDGSKFNMDQMKEPRPIKFKLAPIVDLFTPKALMYGIPEKFGKAVDTDGKKRKALSKRILSWLEPMFKRDNFEKNYCEAFKTELPDCGNKVSKQRGCGYTGSCGAHQKCVTTNTAPYFQCNKLCLSKPAEMNMDYSGNDLTHRENVASWRECRFLCDEYSACFAWTWVTPQFSSHSIRKRCFLKGEGALYQGHHTLAGVVSGAKTCVDLPKVNLHSDATVGYWGDWGSKENCPTNSYVTGFQLKSEAYQGGDDDTALNGVKLFCDGGGEVTSTTQGWGTWGGRKQCPGSNNPVIGFRIKIEKYQGGDDDTAANNMDLYCKRGGSITGDGKTNWGDWSPVLKCPDGMAVVGLQTRVESYQGSGDDTALNGVNLQCAADCPAKAVEKDMDYGGNDVKQSDNVASWEACRTLCDRHSTCFAWTWGTPGSNAPKRCYLKNVRALYENHHRLFGFVSGPMTCGGQGSAGKRDEPVEQDEPVLKEDEPVAEEFEEHVL